MVLIIAQLGDVLAEVNATRRPTSEDLMKKLRELTPAKKKTRPFMA